MVKKTKENGGKQQASPKEVAKSTKNDTCSNRHQMIQEAAYYHAEKRNFSEGDPVKDWLAAEMEIDDQQSKSKNIKKE